MASNQEQAQGYPQINFDEAMIAFGGQEAPTNADVRGVLDQVLQRLTYIEKEIGKASHTDARFDVIERELFRTVRMEKIEQGLIRIELTLEKFGQRLCGIENETEKLASDLKKFSIAITASLKGTEGSDVN